MAELAGVMVGDYFLLECLAREGIVETYRARPTTHGGYDVVLRLFQPQFPDPSGFSEHFASEVEKLWRCRHSHVQPLLEFGTGDDLLYTATLLTETETLQEFLARQPGRFLPIPLVVRLITQVCAALQYIHEQGVIHGNIQPSSILIRTEGDILLTNFSMKHAYQDSAPLGAPVEEENAAYTAPEQALGIIQPASDIYAVGLLLYQLLTDQLPSEIECRDEDGLSHSNEPARTLGIIRPELPEAVETVVRIALAKNPADRFPDATSLAQAFLAAFVSDEQRVVPDVPPQRVNVHTRRTSFIWARAAWLLSISVLLFALIGASFFAFFFPLHMSDIRMPIFSNGGELWPTGNTPESTTTPLPPTSLPFSRSGTPTIRGTVPVGRPMPPYGATPTVPTGGPVLTPIPGTTAVPTPPKTTPIPTEPPVICTSGTLSLDGSPNLEPLLQQVNSDYQVACPKLTISLSGDDSSTALNLLQHDQIDAAVTDLTARPSRNLTDHPIGALPYAVITSPDVQVSSLSTAELQQIYQGQITNWSEVGGLDEAITVVLRPQNDAISAIFRTFVLGGTPEHVQGIKLKQDGPHLVVQAVSHMTGAISYVPLVAVQESNVHVLAIDGASPSAGSIQRGTYPFWSVEHLYTKSDGSSQFQAYVQFFVTPQKLDMMDRFGVVPFRIIRQSILASHLPGPEV